MDTDTNRKPVLTSRLVDFHVIFTNDRLKQHSIFLQSVMNLAGKLCVKQ